MQSTTNTTQARLQNIDALRGFAVIAILLVHSLEHFIYPIYPDITDQPEWLNILDKNVFSVVFSLFAGKSYAIFALLFGITFHLQYHNQQLKGIDFGYRFLWRMLLLAGFASINAAFFPGGDVLLLFSIVSIVLFIFRKCNQKTILIASIILLTQPIEWYHYIASAISSSHRLPDYNVGDLYTQILQHTQSGNWSEFILNNITIGQKASLLWAVGAGRYIQTAGLFLLGFYISKSNRLEPIHKNQRFWTNLLIASAIIYGALQPLKIMSTEGSITTASTIGIVIDMWQKLCFAITLTASFMILYSTRNFQRLTHLLQGYGRMSLTNYITQSIAGALVYFPIGLNLAPHCGYTISLLIGILISIIQMYLSTKWIQIHKQGPLESLWHKLTWIGSKK